MASGNHQKSSNWPTPIKQKVKGKWVKALFIRAWMASIWGWFSYPPSMLAKCRLLVGPGSPPQIQVLYSPDLMIQKNSMFYRMTRGRTEAQKDLASRDIKCTKGVRFNLRVYTLCPSSISNLWVGGKYYGYSPISRSTFTLDGLNPCQAPSDLRAQRSVCTRFEQGSNKAIAKPSRVSNVWCNPHCDSLLRSWY